jgi:hypothetical protein
VRHFAENPQQFDFSSIKSRSKVGDSAFFTRAISAPRAGDQRPRPAISTRAPTIQLATPRSRVPGIQLAPARSGDQAISPETLRPARAPRRRSHVLHELLAGDPTSFTSRRWRSHALHEPSPDAPRAVASTAPSPAGSTVRLTSPAKHLAGLQ